MANNLHRLFSFDTNTNHKVIWPRLATETKVERCSLTINQMTASDNELLASRQDNCHTLYFFHCGEELFTDDKKRASFFESWSNQWGKLTPEQKHLIKVVFFSGGDVHQYNVKALDFPKNEYGSSHFFLSYVSLERYELYQQIIEKWKKTGTFDPFLRDEVNEIAISANLLIQAFLMLAVPERIFPDAQYDSVLKGIFGDDITGVYAEYSENFPSLSRNKNGKTTPIALFDSLKDVLGSPALERLLKELAILGFTNASNFFDMLTSAQQPSCQLLSSNTKTWNSLLYDAQKELSAYLKLCEKSEKFDRARQHLSHDVYQHGFYLGMYEYFEYGQIGSQVKISLENWQGVGDKLKSFFENGYAEIGVEPGRLYEDGKNKIDKQFNIIVNYVSTLKAGDQTLDKDQKQKFRVASDDLKMLLSELDTMFIVK